MIVIKVILWVLLAILVIVAAALSIPVRAVVKYSDDVTLVVKFLFFKFPIDMIGDNDNDSSKDKDSKSSQGKKDKTTDSATKRSDSKKSKKSDKPENSTITWIKKNLKKGGINGFIEILRKLASLAGNLLKPIFKHLRFKSLDIKIAVASDNAADTAINYGYICSAVYPALAIFLRAVKYDNYNVSIAPDFDKKATELDVTAELAVIPWFIVFGAVHALFNYIIYKAKGEI